MKQEREHQEIHLDVVAEGRELNKNQKKKIGYLKFMHYLNLVLTFSFVWGI